MVTGHPQLHSNPDVTLLYANGRQVAEIRDGVLYKRVRFQLKSPPAWALDEAHLEELRKQGGESIELTDDSGHVWRATLADFDAHGFLVDRGYGRQRALRLERWAVT